MVVEPMRDRRAERREATKAEILDAAWEVVRAVAQGSGQGFDKASYDKETKREAEAAAAAKAKK